jgi:alpha-beta hydrolase superfamily lysophospholipase
LIGGSFSKAALASAAFLFVAAGCATRPAVDGLARAPLHAGKFDLFALARQSPGAETLSIYIEGDGAPWAAHSPPRDPTPREPIALALAAADPSPALAWVARPCQYLDAPALAGCDRAYWTVRRFAPEVVQAYDSAVTELKNRSGAQRVRLVGYSGGGVIAVLVAMRRGDVERVVTVAAPLSVADWVAWHRLTPLAGSLDPRREPGAVRVPGVHFAGASDKTVPAGIIAAYVESKGGRLVEIPGFDHECCWARDWPHLLGRASKESERSD